MTFTLPELPYAYDALAPYMSKETLEFHHDKHHKAYVDTGNKLLEGTDLQGKSVEEIVKASYNTNQALFNNAGQHYNHIHFWNWMKPNGGGTPPGAIAKKIDEDLGGFEKFKADFIQAGIGQFGSGWAWLAVKDGKLAILKTRTARTRSCTAPSPSSASMSGSTPTTSTTATAGPTTSRPSSRTS